MGKESWIIGLLRQIGLIKTVEISKEQIVEMCYKACAAGVCPGDCCRCAWGGRSEGE